MAMATKLFLLTIFCVLPAALVRAHEVPSGPNSVPAGHYLVRGRVYCDTCRAGFETSATTYIQGARVRVVCKNRDTLETVYTKEARTDATGTYKILVEEDHKDEMCDCVLVNSPMRTCSQADPGRDRSRLVLTSANGMTSRTRHANNMGFLRHEPLVGCNQLLKQYLNYDEAE